MRFSGPFHDRDEERLKGQAVEKFRAVVGADEEHVFRFVGSEFAVALA